MSDYWVSNKFMGYNFPFTYLGKIISPAISNGGIIVDSSRVTYLGSFFTSTSGSTQTVSGIGGFTPRLIIPFGVMSSGQNSLNDHAVFHFGVAYSGSNMPVVGSATVDGATVNTRSTIDGICNSMVSRSNQTTSLAFSRNIATGVITADNPSSPQNQTIIMRPSSFNNDSITFNIGKTDSVSRIINYLTFGGNNVRCVVKQVSYAGGGFTTITHGITGELPSLIFLLANDYGTTNAYFNIGIWTRNGFTKSIRNRISHNVSTANATRVSSSFSYISSINDTLNNPTVGSYVEIVGVDETNIYFRKNNALPNAVFHMICIYGGYSEGINLSFNDLSQIQISGYPSYPIDTFFTISTSGANNNNQLQNNSIFSFSVSNNQKTISCGFSNNHNTTNHKSFRYNHEGNSILMYNESGINKFSGNIQFTNNDNVISITPSVNTSGYYQGIGIIYHTGSVPINDIYIENFQNATSGDFVGYGSNPWVLTNNLGNYVLRRNFIGNTNMSPRGVSITKTLSRPGYLFFDINMQAQYGNLYIYVNDVERYYLAGGGIGSYIGQLATRRYAIALNSGINTIKFDGRGEDYEPYGYIDLDNIRIMEL